MSAEDVSVADLLEDFGQDLTLTRAGAPTYDPSTGTVSNGSPATVSVRGVFIYRDLLNANGSVVRGADRRLLITAEGATGAPEVGDTVDGTKIAAVRAFTPNGTVVAWDCKVDA
jgi:hypothetical protein